MSSGYNLEMKNKRKYILGRNIKAERTRKALTQEEFAEKIGMSLSHVSKIEQGLTSPTAFALYQMSLVLGVPMDEFFKGIDNFEN